jgi:hypothetical protein
MNNMQNTYNTVSPDIKFVLNNNKYLIVLHKKFNSNLKHPHFKVNHHLMTSIIRSNKINRMIGKKRNKRFNLVTMSTDK